MTSDKTYDRVWAILLRYLRREYEAEGSSASAVARRLDVAVSTVTRWLDGYRGKSVTLKQTLQIIQKLGIPMSEVLRELTPEQAELILDIPEGERDALLDYARLAREGGPAWEMAKQQLKLFASATEKR